KHLNLSIPKPCAEKWHNLKPTSTGGHCGSCSTLVVDFTKMTDQEIFDFFENNPLHSCGRFGPGQLKTYGRSNLPNILPGFALLKAGLACLILMFSSAETFSQTASAKGKIEIIEHNDSPAGVLTASSHIVRGVVKDEAGNPMPGVNVYLKGSTEGTVTDADGRFEFPRRLEAGERLTVSYIGYESMEYVVQSDAGDVIEIVMDLNVMIMGEVVVEKVYTSKSGFRQWLSGFKNIF
ncbi:MAG TPA: carboxypeptidase-like regulatory domain-containing protein, partial [Chryseolinea sp.]